MLRLGTAKVDITPNVPLELAGFAARKNWGPAKEVASPLYARVFYFDSDFAPGTMSDRSDSVVLISADVLNWGKPLVPELNERLKRATGVGEVILHATHTHSGPIMNLGEHRMPDTVLAGYYAELERKLIQAVRAAKADCGAVQGERGEIACRIGMNRRRRAGDRIVIGPNPDGVTDPQLTVIRFRTAVGTVKGVLAHYACHPVVTMNNAFSAEFPGAAMARVEQAVGGGVTAAFLQGACGDINPSLNGRMLGGSGGMQEIEQIGMQLADCILRVLDGPMAALSHGGIRVETVCARLPLQPLPSDDTLRELSGRQDWIGDWSRTLLANPQLLVGDTVLQMTGLKLAEELILVACNAEVVVAYGLYLKERSDNRALLIGYANGMIGYLPTAVQLAEGGYEAHDSIYYFLLPAPYSPEVEPIMKAEMDRLYERITGNSG
jgi:hypothetical protein